MARIHKGILVAGCAVFGAGLIGASLIGFAGGASLDFLRGEQEPVAEEADPAFNVKVAPKPEEDKPAEEKEESLIAAVDSSPKDEPKADPPKKQEKSLSELWLDSVNKGEMLAFGTQSDDRRGSSFEDEQCSTNKLVRVRAVIADNATTDEPGLAVGATTEPIQGMRGDGTYCVAIPSGSIVAFMTGKSGEYATNRAPVSTEMMWLPDGTELKVGQPAKYIDGVPGVVGKANHHTASKTLAVLGAMAFQLADNVTSFGQFSSGDATGPIEEMFRKKFNRPAEISFEGGTPVEFDLMPVSTPGYD